MLDKVTQALGFAMVSLALRNKKQATSFSMAHPSLVSKHCLTLLHYWQNGGAKEYLEGLDTDLRNCLIWNLIGDISADAIASYGLIEV
ncbi:hypothetical protein H6F44_21205 [Pseudanabaena sp. FACHB-1277]|uniref:Uncharacterized protein n=1 Tax=Pseudanabaena cinerea FACHB-1277 TaxID=2949581 RepID=A0A926Z8B0_9CYAN|nr:hypothetical protein [Pseudanabaena cinerea]MBD2152617.1 hypothetical protein [Pseudanabaena cinerea FACHB-1277]